MLEPDASNRRTSGSEGIATRSYGCTCSDWFDHQDRTQCATTGTLPRRAAGAIWRCEALGTTHPHPKRVAGLPVRESRRLPASRRSGTRVDSRANSGELPINAVRTSEPKMLIGLNQNGTWPSAGVSPFPCRRCRATGGEAEPNPSVIHPWNVVSPSSSSRGRPSARSSPMGRRVKDEGGSKGRSVIERIGVEPPRRDHSTRKRADFPRVSPHETVRPTGSGGRADDGSLAAGAASGVFRSSAPDQYRAGGALAPPGPARGLGRGLSGISRKAYVPF
jgi:hypothetical protein